MSERGSSRLAAVIWAALVAITATGAILQIATRNADVPSSFAFRGVDIILQGVVGSAGAMLAARRRENPIGWLLLAAGFGGAVAYLGTQYAIVSIVNHGSTLPLTSGVSWLQNWIWVPVTGMMGIYAVAVFPDGRALSTAWSRFLTFFVPVGLLVFAAGQAFAPGQLQGLPAGADNPYALSRGATNLLASIGGAMFIASFGGAVVSLTKRFRRSSGVLREQLKWLVLAGSGVAVTLAIGLPTYLALQASGAESSTFTDSIAIAIAISLLGIPISMGIAILRYRLYDIDLVINKAVVFGALAAAITAIYVAIVVGIGAAVGSTGRPNVGLSVAATAAVAVLIQPLRAWARRLANRLVYGKRATPHDVLTVLGERISEAYSLDDVLPRLARLVTEATAASHAEVWLRVGGDLRQTAAWPHDPSVETTVPVPADESEIAVPGAEHAYPVRHQGELLGVIALRTPLSESLTSADERLLTDLGSHAGLVLRNLRLIEELRASRQRLVSVQDAERRKIERDLHDGAQQHLVALSINLRLAQSMLDGDLGQTRELLQQLQGDAVEALENLRDLAHGIYPPLLADRGLAAALTSQAAKAPVPTTVDASAIGRYPMEVEAAVYFCVLEALQNIGKYARASSVVVRLGENNGHLEFAVIDDGAGFDSAGAPRGAGLTNMSDRLEALGGRLVVESRVGAGTTIRGFVASAPA